ncbi:penicillin-binding protein 2 [Thermoanaerobacter uzonensis DSM 18761]|uniref:Penicillin-binding protein 2 n=1 Tax=Thermoanaerobacter uzonensis DSM 18761 TaxID=1123369 RepID=A0A1M4VBC5_9THEO|nr:penicillin-binding transpeptidase domain-containing protein [Thermoanaerobacter uzonensis]SHE66128.1 penicillin-binding protein 2 [Thermoanaerobacter uzonensis DSM 18761]
MENRNYRIVFLRVVLSILMLTLIFRLFYIQIIKGDFYSQKAVEQKIRSFKILERRGEIYDRNMIPFTDREYKEYIFAIPKMLTDKEKAAKVISEIAAVDYEDVLKSLRSAKDYVEYEVKFNLDTKLPIGIFKLALPQRYSQNSLARHVIGYVGEKKMGLEDTFDGILNSKREDSIAVFTDGNNTDYIKGLGVRLKTSGKEVLGVKTTLDYHIQKAVENVLDKNMVDGAAVVLDIKTGDILAMASRPNFDQNNIQAYLNSSNEEFINKAVSMYPPGSIFKIVVAAAALEYNKVNLQDTFYCSGSYDINGIIFHDYKGESHGVINMVKGFAVSCNTTFIKIGQITGAKNILEMARKFGIESDDGLPIPEQIGRLPKLSDTYGAGIGNLSIGQGDVLMTPLQAADIAATIANNGVRNVPRLVTAIVDEEGKEIEKLSQKKSYRVISEKTAKILKEMMREVVIDQEGTGKRAETTYGSAGKTGSAEVSKELNIYHAWFTGFVPFDKPKYAISIFVKNGDTGGTKAAPLFKEIAEKIMKY